MKETQRKMSRKLITRLAAIVMALVMVLSVIYIDNRNGKVEAAEEVSITAFPSIDLSEINTAELNTLASKSLTLNYYVGAENTLKYNLGTLSNCITSPEGYTAKYKVGLGTDFEDVNSLTTTEVQGDTTVSIYLVDNTNTSSTGGIQVLNFKVNGFSDASELVNSASISYSTTDKKATVTSTPSIADTTKFLTADNGITFADIADANTYYCGKMVYAIDTSNVSSSPSWQDSYAFDIAEGTDANYYGYAGFQGMGAASPQVSAVSTDTALCDNVAPGIALDNTSSSTINNQKVTDTPSVTFTASEQGTWTVTKNSGDMVNVGTPTLDTTSGNKYTITLPAINDYTASVTYNFKLTDEVGNVSNQVDVTVNYINPDVAINNVTVSVNGDTATALASDASIYSIKDGVILNWEMAYDQNATAPTLGIEKKEADTWVSAGATITNDNGKYAATIDRTTDSIVSYRIEAKNNNSGGSDVYYPFTVCYDSENPIIVDDKVTVYPKDETSGIDAATTKLTYKNAYEIKFTADDVTAGLDTDKCVAYYTIGESNEKNNIDITKVSAADNKVEMAINVAANNESFKGKTVNYYVTLVDKAGNTVSDKEIAALNYYKDNVDVTVDFDFADSTYNDGGNATVNRDWHEQGTTVASVLTNAKTYKVKVSITSDAQIDENTIVLNNGTGDVTGYTNYTVSGSDTNGDYTTTFEYSINESISSQKQYTLKASNTNKQDGTGTATILFVDITNPNEIAATVTAENTVSSTDPGAKTWYRNLTVAFDAKDENGGYKSGIKEFCVSQDGGTNYSSEQANKDGKYSIKINPSETTNGTKVRVYAEDNAGNKTYWPTDENMTYYVDNTAPTANLTVTNNNETVNSGSTIAGNPTIDASIAQGDALGGKASIVIKYKDATGNYVDVYTYSNEDGSDISIVNQTLSSLIGASNCDNGNPKDGTYLIELNASDNISSMDTVSFEVTIDNTAPDLTGIVLNNGGADINATTADINKYEAANYCFDGYNKTLDVTFNAADATSTVQQVVVTQTAGTETKPKTETFNGGTANVTILDSDTNAGTKVTVTMTDAEGNSRSYTYHFLVDNAVPTVALSVEDDRWTDNNTTLNGNPVIASSDSDNILVNARSMAITKPDGSTVTITDTSRIGEKKLSELIGAVPADGRYTVSVSASDRAGHAADASLSFVVDNTIPVNEMKVTAADPAKIAKYNNTLYDGTVYGQYYAGDVTASLKVTDVNPCDITVTDNDRVISPEWTLAGGVYTATVTASAEGAHTIRMTSIDSADNVGVAREVSFIIDKTVPAITTTLNGANYTNATGIVDLTTDATVNVSVADTNKDEADLTQTIVRTIPGQEPTTTTQLVGEGATAFNVEADYAVSYLSVDRAGNAGETRTVNFRVDKTAPALTITGISEGGTSQSGVTLTFGIEEAFYWDMPAGEINVYRTIDGSAETLVDTIEFRPASANDTVSQSFSEDGEYRFEFTASDRAGNSANMTYTFILDQNAPLIALSGVANYGLSIDPVTLMIEVTEDFYSSNDVTLSGTRQYMDENNELRTENITFSPHNFNAANFISVEETFEEDGIYDITVTSVDAAGNSDEKTIHFTIDSTEPVIAYLEEFDGTMLTSFSWNYDYDDLVSDLTVCDVVITMDGVEYDGSTELADGVHTLVITATDENGHEATASYTFTLDQTAPVILVNGIEDGDRIEEETEITVTVDLSEDTLDSVTLNGVEQTVTGNVATFTVSEDGEYVLVAKAHDEAGNTSEVSISFEYGSGMSIIWIIIICVVCLAALIFFIILLKRRKKDR